MSESPATGLSWLKSPGKITGRLPYKLYCNGLLHKNKLRYLFNISNWCLMLANDISSAMVRRWVSSSRASSYVMLDLSQFTRQQASCAVVSWLLMLPAAGTPVMPVTRSFLLETFTPNSAQSILLQCCTEWITFDFLYQQQCYHGWLAVFAFICRGRGVNNCMHFLNESWM